MACRRLRRTRTFRFPPFRYNKRNHPVLFFVPVYAETVLTHATAGWRERHMPRHDDKPTNRPSKPKHGTRNGGPLYKEWSGGRGDSLFAALSLNSGQKVETFFSPLMMKKVALRPRREPGEKFQCRRKRRRRRRKTGQRQSCLDRLLNIVAVLSSSSLPFYSPSFSVP